MNARALAVAVAVALAGATGCATTVPLQTASVVDDGVTRIGAEGNAALFCGSLNSVADCALYPDGFALPELRASVRRGVGDGLDFGAAVAARAELYAVDRPLGATFTFDAKRELWSRRLGLGPWAERLVVSVNPLVALGASGALGLAPTVDLELGAPLHVGLVQGGGEWVASLRLSQRLQLPQLGAEPPTPYRGVTTTRLGVAAGYLFRDGLAVQLGYQSVAFGTGYLSRADGVPAEVNEAFTTGAWQLSVGWLWDVR